MGWIGLAWGFIGLYLMLTVLMGFALGTIMIVGIVFVVYVEIQYYSCRCMMFKKPDFCKEL